MRKEKFPMFITALKKVDILSMDDTIKHRCHWIREDQNLRIYVGLDEVLEEFLDALPSEVKSSMLQLFLLFDESDLHTGLARVVRLHLRRI